LKLDKALKYRVDFYDYELLNDEFVDECWVATWCKGEYVETRYYDSKEAALSKSFYPTEELVRKVLIGTYVGPELMGV